MLAFASAFMLLPIEPAQADCTHPPFPSTSDDFNKIRSYPIVVRGNISGSAVPKDAHGKYSFYLDVLQWYTGGRGQTQIEVTNYGTSASQLPPDYDQPGNSTSMHNSGQFLIDLGGQEAILFL